MSKLRWWVSAVVGAVIGCGGGGGVGGSTQPSPAKPPAAPAPSRAPEPVAVETAREHARGDEPADLEVRVKVLLRPKGSEKRVFWLYQPHPVPERLGLVLHAPARSRFLGGAELHEELDRPWHLPFVKAGFAVIAYSIDGSVRPGDSPRRAQRALQAYLDSEAGLDNARAAMGLAREQLPTIEDDLVFAVGHGGAAAHALWLGAELSELRAVVAWAPPTRLTGPEAATARQIDGAVPGFFALVKRSVPENHASRMRVPLLLMHAADDDVVPVGHTRHYAKRLPGDVQYDERARGGHGAWERALPTAVRWLRQRRDGT